MKCHDYENYWVSQLDERERRHFENMANGLVVAQEIRSKANNRMTNYGPSNSSGEVQPAPVSRLEKTAQFEQSGLFDTSFADIWRDAQRRRSTYYASRLTQVFRRFRRTNSTEVSMQEAANQIVFRRDERPSFELSTGVTELCVSGDATNGRDKAA